MSFNKLNKYNNIKMEFTQDNKKELFNDLLTIVFRKGDLNTSYKYQALIPKDIWNKWRPDKPLKKGEYRTISFGRPGYQQYKDLIGDWTEYDHNDEHRRENYKKRHEPIMIGLNGKKYHSYLVPFTNEFFSYWLMW